MLIRQLGHDGSEIVNPDQPEPFCRRAFHERELVDLAYAHGVWMIRVDRNLDHIGLRDYNLQRFHGYIYMYSTIIIGSFPTLHAVISDDRKVFDPKGYVTPLNNFIAKWDEQIESIYILKRMIE